MKIPWKFLGLLLAGSLLSGVAAAAGDGAAAVAQRDTPNAIPALRLQGYARETLPGAAVSAAYLSLHNTGSRDLRLTGVELPGLEDVAVHLHTTVDEGGVSRMRALAELVVPAGAEVRMAPGRVHLMLHGVRLRAGEQLSLRLRFAGGRVAYLRVPVHPVQPAQGHHHHG